MKGLIEFGRHSLSKLKSLFVEVTGDTMTGALHINTGSTGLSTLNKGLEVNKNSGTDADSDFTVNTGLAEAIKVDASAETLTLGVTTTAKRAKYSATTDMGSDDEDLASKKYVDDHITYAELAVTSKTADYTATSSDTVILVDATSGDVTITLPAVSSGLHYYIKKTDSSSNKVIVDGDGSETIDGSTTQDIISQYDAMEIVSDGTSWSII